MVLWRSSQLYSVSAAYTLLSVITGTSTAFRAKFFDGDNTALNSFRVSGNQLTKAWKDIWAAESTCSLKFVSALYEYVRLVLLSFYFALQLPDFVTKWLAASFFLFQIACIIASVYFINKGNASYIIITFIVCGLNIMLCVEITMLLAPSLSVFQFLTRRPEYFFAALSLFVIITVFIQNSFPLEIIENF